MKISSKIKSFQIIILGTFSILLLTIFLTAIDIYTYGKQKTLLKADAAIVLGAAVWGEKPSPVFRERINHAVNLYQDRKINTIIFTGGVGKNKALAEAIVAKNYAIAKGVKEADILIETTSLTTGQNLFNAQKVAASHHLKQILIISDPLHLKRAVLMAQDLGMNAYPSPTPTTRYRSFNSQMKFLSRETYFYLVYLCFKK
jgi:uncharacterized SAM-binding protein YcdF (DUF218 family)